MGKRWALQTAAQKHMLDLQSRQAFGWPWGTTERVRGHTVPTCKDTQPDSEMPWDKGGGWEKSREGRKVVLLIMSAG